MKKILEDIKTNTYERFYLFYGEEKYMISQMKNQLKKALVSEDDTMNYSCLLYTSEKTWIRF